MAGKLFFTLQYWLNNPPWDTEITPPEVFQFLESHPPGKALDLGCGTGTNAITIAKNGWQATGIDFVSKAIKTAKRKAKKAGVSQSTMFISDSVLRPGFVEGKYDLILDIGCFHSFRGEDIHRYARNIPGLLSPGGTLLMYVHLAENEKSNHGATEAGIKVLKDQLALHDREDGEESSRPSAWLKFKNSN
jgi:cyclopropane fatty-acyl-phospholipid synthase-like methyltransferase